MHHTARQAHDAHAHRLVADPRPASIRTCAPHWRALWRGTGLLGRDTRPPPTLQPEPVGAPAASPTRSETTTDDGSGGRAHVAATVPGGGHRGIERPRGQTPAARAAGVTAPLWLHAVAAAPCRPAPFCVRPFPAPRCMLRRFRSLARRSRLASATASTSARLRGSPSTSSAPPSGVAPPSGLWRQYHERVGSNSGVWNLGCAHPATSSLSTASARSPSERASSTASRSSTCSRSPECSSLNRCERAWPTLGGGWAAHAARYLRASSAWSMYAPEAMSRLPMKRAGFSSSASDDMAAAAPVAARHASASASDPMPPFAMTGTSTAATTAATADQWAEPDRCLFCSLVRPCTQSTDAPASTIRSQSCTVASSEGSSRTLAVTGTSRPRARAPTNDTTSSGSSSRKAPYRPLRAMACGQPKLRSTASTWPWTKRPASRSTAGSCPASCAKTGPSRPAGSGSKVWVRYAGCSTMSRACSIGV
mmetsp:Transcript_34460/g.111217  ORF Transcript_34460/g.111217 Transcript_34460/m.111217 type:complete len:479 (-) Transcript_34460:150-1586(-)